MAKKTRSGKVAMDHARNIVNDFWPSTPKLEAQKSVVWIPDPKLPGGRRPLSRREDLWGCIDILVLTLPDPWLIQVTSQTKNSQSATARKRKIEALFLSPHTFEEHRPHIEVWSWVARKYFYTWSWSWETCQWGQRAELVDPTMGRKVKAAAPKDDGLDEVF